MCHGLLRVRLGLSQFLHRLRQRVPQRLLLLRRDVLLLHKLHRLLGVRVRLRQRVLRVWERVPQFLHRLRVWVSHRMFGLWVWVSKRVFGLRQRLFGRLQYRLYGVQQQM